ncbi:hypothetical protein [Absidia glauca]|uniref:Uncharacterized protein n=1 Tax=Absidia glauca TaxID=4829 RepID=A0A168Q4W2_ABSGL|nr:hypothetical protein [Absidia glauca]
MKSLGCHKKFWVQLPLPAKLSYSDTDFWASRNPTVPIKLCMYAKMDLTIMYMSLDSLQLFGLYDMHGIVMVMDLRNVFRRMIQVGFIDGIGLKSYRTGYVWGRS